MSSLFASDLHLDPAAPAIAARFLRFLDGPARQATSLYLLGDLFEAWIGDDEPEPAHREVMRALRRLAEAGTAVYVMRGNRDFLLGERFCREAGALLLDDPVIATIHGTRVLVSHGDGLCTDDRPYQRLRALVRDPRIRRGFEALPIGRRRALAAQARAGSREHLAAAGEYITDVNQQAVEALMRAAGVRLLVHGHTHRPAVHRFRVGGEDCTRIVLGDWHGSGRYLHWDDEGYRLADAPA